MAIVMGVLPNVFLRPMEPAVKRTIERVTGRSYASRSRRGSARQQCAIEQGVVAPQVSGSRIPDRASAKRTARTSE